MIPDAVSVPSAILSGGVLLNYTIKTIKFLVKLDKSDGTSFLSAILGSNGNHKISKKEHEEICNKNTLLLNYDLQSSKEHYINLENWMRKMDDKIDKNHDIIIGHLLRLKEK